MLVAGTAHRHPASGEACLAAFLRVGGSLVAEPDGDVLERAGGCKFIKLDMAFAGQSIEAVQSAGDHAGAPADAPRTRGASLHPGSTCRASASRTTPPAEACANPSLVAVRLEGFDPTANVVVIAPAQVLATAGVDFNTPDTSPGCMSLSDDCIPIMARLGLAFRDLTAGDQLIATMR